MLPLLYLHGLSSSDFGPALTQLLGTKRSLAGTDYVYCWIDGIHLEVRLSHAGLTFAHIGI